MRTDKNDGHTYPFLAIKNKTGEKEFEVVLFTKKVNDDNPRYTPLEPIIGPRVVRYSSDAKFYHKFDTKKGREKVLELFRSVFK